MVFDLFLDDERREAKAEGKAEGLVEGKAEGLVEGKAEGLAEGRIEASRKILLDLLDELGTLSPELLQKIHASQNDDFLAKLIKLAAKAQSMDDFAVPANAMFSILEKAEN